MRIPSNIPFCAVLLLIAFCVCQKAYADRIASDTLMRDTDYTLHTVCPAPDVTELSENAVPSTDYRKQDWWQLVKKRKLSLSDTTVRYPRVLKFFVDLYNWGDRAFNSYDTTYVVGTGRRWKARLISDNWVDSYALDFSNKMPIRIMSDIYFNAGAYLQYMAVSVGYTIDLSNVIGNRPSNHKKLEFGFNCARFNIEAHYWENTGGSYIRRFGNYNNGKLFKLEFPGVDLRSFGVSAYYFLNNRKYSQGAAYNYSKIQKKNAGSFIFGVSYNDMSLSIQFSKIPIKLRPFLTIPSNDMKIHYLSYCLSAGYGYNWVLNKHFLFNFTAMPEFGVTHCYEDSFEGSSTLFAMNIRARVSLSYNHNDFFICAVGKLDGSLYKTGKTSLFSSIENGSISVGFRF